MSLDELRAALDEHAQTCSAPSHAFSAGLWCETAGGLLLVADALLGRVEAAEAAAERPPALEQAVIQIHRLEGRAERAEAERDALRAFVEANVDHDHVWENHPTRPIRTLVHSPECRLCAVLAASVPSGPAAGPTTSKETR